MSEKHTFRAVIENPGGGGAFVRVPFDVEQVFGKKRVPVKVTIDSEPYRGTLVRMGELCHILIVLKEIRQKIGKDFGDEIEVVLEEDTQPRVVEVPADFQQALMQARAPGWLSRRCLTRTSGSMCAPSWMQSTKPPVMTGLRKPSRC